MWPKSQSTEGYTLVEVLIVLASMVVILSLAAQMLFETSRLTSRQESQVEPRQTVRSALDYVSFMVRGACDFNRNPDPSKINYPFPNALLFWYSSGAGGSASGCPGGTNCVQASYNNITAAQAAAGVGDEGTDILAVVKPVNTAVCPSFHWPGFQHAANSEWTFNLGCGAGNDDAANMALFKQLTGAHPDPTKPSQEISRRLVLFDDKGAMAFVQITGYTSSDCANDIIHVGHNQGNSQDINPPGGQPNLTNPKLALGTRFVTLRVCQGWLEEKDGLLEYDSKTGNLIASDQCPVLPTGTTEYPAYVQKSSWIPLLSNIEDTQFAYLYLDGTVFNDRVGHVVNSASGGIPGQGNTALSTDGASIRAVRVTISGRSTKAAPGEVHTRYIRPAAEDRLAASGRDKFYHFQQSAFVMLRSRNSNV